MRYLVLICSLLCFALPVKADGAKSKKTNAHTPDKGKVLDKLPPLKTGFLIDLDPTNRDGFFYFGFETCSWELFNQRWSADLGVASGRLIAGLGLGLWFDGAVGPFVWGGYNISENAPAWGIGFNMLKL